jgi:VWFA-related protein
MATFKRVFFIILLICLIIPSSARGQTTSSIQVNDTSVSEGETALTLGVIFTILDEDGQAISDPQIESAEILQVDTGARYAATTHHADTPFYIVMVLDASGSMVRAAADLRNAASQAISSAPSGARFAVVEFNNMSTLLQEFTEVQDRITNAINQVQPIDGAGTCLYAAAYGAIQLLENIPSPSRRAVILFTDGVDELPASQGGGPCSSHVFDEVVSLARNDKTSIHTIGMSASSSRINADELASMSSSTGGFARVGGQGDLSGMFSQIMDALNSQYIAQADMYPTQGQHQAVLTVTMRDGSTLSQSFSFTSSRDYLLPANVAINRVEYNSGQDIYTLYFNFTSPQLIDHIKVAVWNTKSGVQIAEYSFDDLANTQSFEIPTTGMTAGEDYEFRIAALKPDEQPVNDSSGNPITIDHQFSYEPTIVKTELSIPSVAIQDQELLVNIQLTGASQVASFEGWLIDQSTNAQVPGSIFSAAPTDTTVRIPMTGLAAGKYTVVLRALDNGKQLITETQYEGVSYTPPTPPSKFSVLFQGIANGLKSHIWIVIAIIAIIIFGMAAVIAIPIIARRQTGTPVLQGKIETTLSKSSEPSPLNLTRMLPGEKIRSSIPSPVKPAEPPSSPRATPQAAKREGPSSPRPITPAPQREIPSSPRPAAPVQPREVPSTPRPAVSAPASTEAVLKVVFSPDTSKHGQILKLSPKTYTIGRENCDLIFKDDRKISRKHAIISFDAGTSQYMITDLGSANGVSVNNVRISPNKPTPLIHGTTILLGPDTRILFERH